MNGEAPTIGVVMEGDVELVSRRDPEAICSADGYGRVTEVPEGDESMMIPGTDAAAIVRPWPRLSESLAGGCAGSKPDPKSEMVTLGRGASTSVTRIVSARFDASIALTAISVTAPRYLDCWSWLKGGNVCRIT